MKTIIMKHETQFTTIALIKDTKDQYTPFIVTSNLFKGEPLEWSGGSYYTTYEEAIKDYKHRLKGVLACY